MPDADRQAEIAEADRRGARLRTGALVVIAVGVVLVMLREASFILSALVVATILFSLASDAIAAVARLRVGRLHVPQWLASLVALAMIALALFTLTSLILAQINEVLGVTLAYAARAPEATADLFRWAGPEIEEAVLEAMRSLDLTGAFTRLASEAGDLMQGAVLVILFVAFMFGERISYQAKLRGLFGDRARAAEARAVIGSIMHQVNHYLLVKTAVSALTGALVFAASHAFGLTLAGALALVTFLLNYLPNLGSIAATLLAGLVAHVQFADSGNTLAFVALISAIQFGCGNVLDPYLTGRTLRLSTLGILFSLAFWGALWGVAGMFLSVPIMVAAMIVCSRSPRLRPIAVILSRDGLPDRRVHPAEAADRPKAARTAAE
ncbi:MAG TPA: AI-2E family transporter [Paracoccaceae bacterium]|nr:AI-2E family transporter [Paracoccaceae bacterium]